MDDTVLVAALSTLGVVLLTVLLYLYRQRQTPPPAPSVRAIDPSVKKSKKSKKSKAKEGTSKPTPSTAPTKKGPKPKKSKESSQQPSSVPTAEAQPTPDVTDVLFENYYYDSSFEQFDPMTENGNTEHTMNIQDDPNLIEQYRIQMELRLAEGINEAIFVIGMDEEGVPLGIDKDQIGQSFDSCKKIAGKLDSTASVLRIRNGKEEGKYVMEVIIRKSEGEGRFKEVRIAVIGNVDTGKTTLLGVLSKGGLDNGRGKARANIFKHKHEIETGRTSDISREILGFDSEGKILNYNASRAPSWNEICEHAAKVLLFMDLAGHERYLKTTVFGLTGNYPDYTMLMVGSNMGVIGMTKEHYHLTLALKLPCFIVVTKIDICPPNILEQTLTVLKRLLKAPGSKKLPLMVNTMDDVILAARNFNSERMAPIFQISNVTGENLDLLRMFLSLISPRKNWQKLREEPALLHVDNTFSVPGVGTVVSGILTAGEVGVNETILLGPNHFGRFDEVLVKSIHTNRLPVKNARAGQSISLALKKVKRSATRKGQVLASPAMQPAAVWEFDADIFVITHSTTITTNYEAVIHCSCTRQTATIIDVEGILRAGLRGRVRFRYKYRPEFIQEGDRIIFREGKTKGIGSVHKVHPHYVPPPKRA